MGDEKVRTAAEVAHAVRGPHGCNDGGTAFWVEAVAVRIIESDRTAAEARGYARGYARGAIEALDALLEHVATEQKRAKSREEFLDICASHGLVMKLIRPHVDAIRARFGGGE